MAKKGGGPTDLKRLKKYNEQLPCVDITRKLIQAVKYFFKKP